MGTYDINKLLSAYAGESITVEQAVGHSLQHLAKLYEAQAGASISRADLRNDINALSLRLATLQADVDRLLRKE